MQRHEQSQTESHASYIVLGLWSILSPQNCLLNLFQYLNYTAISNLPFCCVTLHGSTGLKALEINVLIVLVCRFEFAQALTNLNRHGLRTRAT